MMIWWWMVEFVGVVKVNEKVVARTIMILNYAHYLFDEMPKKRFLLF